MSRTPCTHPALASASWAAAEAAAAAAPCKGVGGGGGRVQGPGSRTKGSGSRVQGPGPGFSSGSRFQGSCFRVQGSGCRVLREDGGDGGGGGVERNNVMRDTGRCHSGTLNPVSRVKVLDLKFGFQGPGARCQGLRFRVQGSGFRDQGPGSQRHGGRCVYCCCRAMCRSRGGGRREVLRFLAVSVDSGGAIR